jgi:acetyl-CoA carboxylase biotin carboxyl carrier protein
LTGNASGDRRQPGTGDRVSIAELREHARIFVTQAPGPLLSLRMRAGDALIEVRWHRGAEDPAAVQADGSAPGGSASHGPTPDEPTADDERMIVRAPLVGTFYRAPAPGRPPFVEAGDHVTPNQTIGIIEAMKLMNSVTAGQQGQVAEILVGDETPVEFGQPLIALVPEGA